MNIYTGDKATVYNIGNPTIHHNFLIGSEKHISKNFPTSTELNTLIERTSVSWNLHVNYKKNAHELMWMNILFIMLKMWKVMLDLSFRKNLGI